MLCNTKETFHQNISCKSEADATELQENLKEMLLNLLVVSHEQMTVQNLSSKFAYWSLLTTDIVNYLLPEPDIS